MSFNPLLDLWAEQMKRVHTEHLHRGIITSIDTCTEPACDAVRKLYEEAQRWIRPECTCEKRKRQRLERIKLHGDDTMV